MDCRGVAWSCVGCRGLYGTLEVLFDCVCCRGLCVVVVCGCVGCRRRCGTVGSCRGQY